MTRLKYYEQGIKPLVSGNLSRANSNLDSAIYYCNFSIPSDFAYRDYMYSLKRTIKNYKNRLEKIISQVPRTDDELLKVINNIDRVIQMDPLDKIPEKERLIK